MNMNNFKKMTYQDHKSKTYDKIRYNDTDKQGHVNNSNFSTFFDTGRVELLYIPDNPLFDEGCEFVIASSKIDFLAEIKWPGQVEIGTSILEIGRSSVHMIQSIYQMGVLVSISYNVTVQIDQITRKSRPLSDITKTKLQPFLLDKN